MQIDCTTCPARGQHCGGCMVTALWSLAPAAPQLADSALDATELSAIDILVRTGLIGAGEAAAATAQREQLTLWSSAG